MYSSINKLHDFQDKLTGEINCILCYHCLDCLLLRVDFILTISFFGSNDITETVGPSAYRASRSKIRGSSFSFRLLGVGLIFSKDALEALRSGDGLGSSSSLSFCGSSAYG